MTAGRGKANIETDTFNVVIQIAMSNTKCDPAMVGRQVQLINLSSRPDSGVCT